MKHDVWIRKILRKDLEKWYKTTMPNNWLFKVNERLPQEIKAIKRAEIMIIGEYGSHYEYGNCTVSGLWLGTKISVMLSGCPTIDSRRATLEGKNLMIRYGNDVVNHRKEAEKENIVFINFNKLSEV